MPIHLSALMLHTAWYAGPAWLHCCTLSAGADLRRCGLATHYISSSALPRVEAALEKLGLRAHAQGAVDQVLCSHEVPDALSPMSCAVVCLAQALRVHSDW